MPGVYRTQVDDVLLAALGRVLADWTGRQSVLIDLEGHGREQLFDDVDLSRTVGWFTSMYPVELTVGADWAETVKSVKEQLRAVPNKGVAGLIHATAEPRISFNYLGQFTDAGTLDSDIGPDERRPHQLDVVGMVQGGKLELTWQYSTQLHREATVRRLADAMLRALREIVGHCAWPGAGGRTPSDFPLARLDQSAVDTLVGDGRDVEDIYPLTPLQAGMLFHSLVEPEIYVDQARMVLDGVSDPVAFGQAWQAVVDRTPALRTRLAWDGLEEPVQIVQRHVTVPIAHYDWQGLDREAMLAGYAGRRPSPGLRPHHRPAVADHPGEAVAERGAAGLVLPSRAARRLVGVPGAVRCAGDGGRRRTSGASALRRLRGMAAPPGHAGRRPALAGRARGHRGPDATAVRPGADHQPRHGIHRVGVGAAG